MARGYWVNTDEIRVFHHDDGKKIVSAFIAKFYVNHKDRRGPYWVVRVSIGIPELLCQFNTYGPSEDFKTKAEAKDFALKLAASVI